MKLCRLLLVILTKTINDYDEIQIMIILSGKLQVQAIIRP